jgi:probable H4MPT-linked C1 transfer pathway protein
MTIIGWDVGGAHLKVARIEQGRLVGARVIPCPLWLGVDRLDAAIAQARAELGDAECHAVTMTGELTDLFASRAEGVTAISRRLLEVPGVMAIYGGRDGWLEPDQASHRADAIASANWHATAGLVAQRVNAALFVDIGSTTADLIPVSGGRIHARGYADRERLATGELVYTGATRTALMAVAQKAPFRGAWTGVMNEYFATMADVYRVLELLPEGADLHETADHREQTRPASIARLARMVGADAVDADDASWAALAGYFAEKQLRRLHDAALVVLSAAELPGTAPLVGAGTGAFIAEALAERLGRRFISFSSLIDVDAGMEHMASVCAPAVAVALLSAAQRGSA